MGKTFTCDVDVRWGDSDRLGHVNNTKYFEYAQEARVQFFRACGMTTGFASNHAVVLRKAGMDFLSPVTDESGPLSVETAVQHVGTSSYSMTHTMRDSEGVMCAIGTAVMVGFDAETQTSRTLTDDERAVLSDYLAEDSSA